MINSRSTVFPKDTMTPETSSLKDIKTTILDPILINNRTSEAEVKLILETLVNSLELQWIEVLISNICLKDSSHKDKRWIDQNKREIKGKIDQIKATLMIEGVWTEKAGSIGAKIRGMKYRHPRNTQIWGITLNQGMISPWGDRITRGINSKSGLDWHQNLDRISSKHKRMPRGNSCFFFKTSFKSSWKC